MPETTDHKNLHVEDKRESAEECEDEKKDSWSQDQKKRSYYYDDASGYEVYLPEDEDEEDKPVG